MLEPVIIFWLYVASIIFSVCFCCVLGVCLLKHFSEQQRLRRESQYIAVPNNNPNYGAVPVRGPRLSFLRRVACSRERCLPIQRLGTSRSGFAKLSHGMEANLMNMSEPPLWWLGPGTTATP